MTTKVSSPLSGAVHGGQGAVRRAVLPPTAVTHGEPAQVADAGPDETVPPNLIGDLSAVRFGQQLQVYGRGTDGHAWSDVYTVGQGWSGWQDLGGTFA